MKRETALGAAREMDFELNHDDTTQGFCCVHRVVWCVAKIDKNP